MFPESVVDRILDGAFDMHVHVAPDIKARRLDAIDLIKEAYKARMRGVLIKSHITETAGLAYLLNKLFPRVKVFGCLALNHTVGGLNPQAVKAAIRYGVKEVFMPTYSAANHLKTYEIAPEIFPYPLPKGSRGISVVSKRGELLPEVEEILQIMAEGNVILGTGHLSIPETMILIQEAKSIGVRKILVTHPTVDLINMPIERQVEAARLGAYLEHDYIACTPVPLKPVSPSKIAEAIRAVGVKHCVMATDFGQIQNPSPIEGLRMFIKEMLNEGFSKENIRTMVHDNPAMLLGLSE